MQRFDKKNLIRWGFSSLVTFISGFAFAMIGSIDEITLESIKTGSYVGVIFTATRAGFKALLELFIIWYQNK